MKQMQFNFALRFSSLFRADHDRLKKRSGAKASHSATLSSVPLKPKGQTLSGFGIQDAPMFGIQDSSSSFPSSTEGDSDQKTHNEIYESSEAYMSNASHIVSPQSTVHSKATFVQHGSDQYQGLIERRNSSICTVAILKNKLLGIHVDQAAVVEFGSESSAVIGIQCLKMGAELFVATDFPDEYSLSKLRASLLTTTATSSETLHRLSRNSTISDSDSIYSMPVAHSADFATCQLSLRAVDFEAMLPRQLTTPRSDSHGNPVGRKSSRMCGGDPTASTPKNWMVSGHKFGEKHSLNRILKFHPARYDLVISNDCLWSSDNHGPLLKSMAHLLKLSGRALLVCGVNVNYLQVYEFMEMAWAEGFGVESVDQWFILPDSHVKHELSFTPETSFKSKAKSGYVIHAHGALSLVLVQAKPPGEKITSLGPVSVWDDVSRI